MSERDRPIETIRYAGARVEVVDAEAILAAAGSEPVQVLQPASFPDPVRQVQVSILGTVRDLRPVHLLTAEIRQSDGGPSPERIRSVLLGNDPLGLLLSRRIAEGDQWATRVVDGMGDAAALAYRGLGLHRRNRAAGAGPAVLEDEAAGLRAELSYQAAGTVVRVRAEVPTDTVRPAHLYAMVRLTLRVVVSLLGEQAGPEPLAGRRYLVAAEHVPSEPATSRSVTLDQVGGLTGVVAELRQVAVSFRHP